MYKIWTKEEEQFLIDNYTKLGPEHCAESLNRTVKSIYKKADRLNLTKNLIRSKWSEHDIQFLISNYMQGSDYCAQKLNRSVSSVKSKAFDLKLTKSKIDYSEQETQFLVDSYAEKGPTYCVEKLSRTYGSITTKAARLDLQANTNYNSNIVYVVYFSDLFLYKIGVTNNVERRIKRFGHPCVILKTEECETPQEAAELERDLLKSVTLINTGYLNSGNTETFIQPSEKIKQFLGKQFAE